MLFPVVLSNLLVLGLILYFRYSPTTISDFFSDFLLLLSITILIFILTYLPLTLKRSKNVLLPFLRAMILLLLIKGVPNTRMLRPPLPNPHYYFVRSLNLLEDGMLMPLPQEL